MDPCITKVAQILVNHSAKVKKGDRVVIVSDISAKPLALEVYRLSLLAKAKSVRVNFDCYELAEIFYGNADINQLKNFPKVANYEIKNCDCSITIRSSTNTRALSGIETSKIGFRQKILRPIIDYRVEKTRWVVTTFPTEAQAQEADMSLGEYSDFVFGAINNVDWNKIKGQQEKLVKLLNKTKIVHILGLNTDLVLNIAKRKAVSAAGEMNMPDGEVFTSVVENSTSGKIEFSYPAIFMGREFTKVVLVFEKGKVVKATAAKGEKELNKILNTDKGARYLGELGIGNNFKIDKFTKDILFDEKIGGSIHLALGKSYKENLGRNVSSIHWDMICDLRQGGELWFDQKLVQKNGQWLV